jgi:hypothetical protein
MGTKTAWSEKLSVVMKTPGFEQVRGLGLVRDADDDPRDAFRSLSTLLASTGFPTPDRSAMIQTDPSGTLKGGILIVPSGSRRGELEDLVLASVADHPRMHCVTRYLECVRDLDGPHEEPSKAKIATFVAGDRKPWLRLGEAAEAGVFPLDSSKFRTVRRFLKALA